MNKLFLCLLFLFSVHMASSQRVYFVYIQTETDQPFYLKMGPKTYSSSASGYLVLSKLADSSYNFSIGFAQNKWPEQSFSVAVNKKDHGYLLKNFGEKGWGLFDLQTLSVQMSLSGSGSKTDAPIKTDNKDVSVFTDILAKASDDPSLREKPVQSVPAVEKNTLPAEKREDSKVVAKENVTVKPVETNITTTKTDPPKTEIKKEDPKTVEKDPVTIKPVETNTARAEKTDPSVTEIKKEDPKTVAKDPGTIKPVESNPASTNKTDTPKTEIKKEEISTIATEPVTAKPVENNQSVPEKVDSPKTGIKKEEPRLVADEKASSAGDSFKRSVVTKKSESSTTQGFGLMFIDDFGNGTRDTINIIIPNPQPLVAAPKEQPKEEKKFLDISSEAAVKTEEKKPVADVAVKDTVAVKPVADMTVKDTMAVKPAGGTNCPLVAQETDFFTLRKLMAAVEGDDEMIGEAKKYFKTKCFSTAQAKNLGALFLSDEGKYKFFDAIYNHITDPSNFPSLQGELKEDYFINRFKAMLRN